MNSQPLPSASPATRPSVHACVEYIEQAYRQGLGQRRSPLSAVFDVVHSLQQAPPGHAPLRLINDRADNRQGDMPVSAWAQWFGDAAPDPRPLVYLTQSPTSAHLVMLARQIDERGIVLNDLESSPSRWAKGAHPWLPLWLAGNRQCLPFDPACADEALAILAGALQALYVDGQPGFCYLHLHDEPRDGVPGDGVACEPRQAWLGMYRLKPANGTPHLRLLGAGLLLGEVRAAAQLLEQDWGVACELWSCPSYTRLARDAQVAERRNRRHAGEPPHRCHLHDCLGDSDAPVLAVTGYAEFVAAQLGAHLDTPFSALGADSLAPGQRLNRHWIVYVALQGLARVGRFSDQALGQVLQRYRLD